MANVANVAKRTEELSLGILDFTMTARGGLLVNKIDKFGSAAKSGVHTGDELLTINGDKFASGAQVKKLCTDVGAGGKVLVKLVRAGKPLEVSVTIRAPRILNLDMEEVHEVLERKIAP